MKAGGKVLKGVKFSIFKGEENMPSAKLLTIHSQH